MAVFVSGLLIAAFVIYGVIKLLSGKAGELAATLRLVWTAFVLYFALPLIERAIRGSPNVGRSRIMNVNRSPSSREVATVRQ
jgi:hypothetical protein